MRETLGITQFVVDADYEGLPANTFEKAKIWMFAIDSWAARDRMARPASLIDGPGEA